MPSRLKAAAAAVAAACLAGALAWAVTAAALSYPYFLEFQRGADLSATLMRLLDVIWLFALLPSTLLAALLLTQRHDGGTMICGVSMAIWYLLAIAALSWMNTDMVPWDWLAVVNIWSKRLPMALTVGAVFGATFRSRLRVA